MKGMHKSIIGLIFLLICSTTVFGQKAERKNIREGNKLYINKKFTESEIAYRKSIEVNPRSVEGAYNLGNALYQQGKFPEAAEQYQLVASQGKRLLEEKAENRERLAQVFHNLGNIGMKNKDYAKSVEAYRQSLRLNSRDDETRYNLALAQKLLQNQQQEQDKSQDDKNKDQEKDQNKDDKQEQEQQQQQDDKKENKTQQEQQQQEQMSKDNAQQMLDAFLQDEKNTQEKVKKAQAKQQQSRKTDKQW
ncbi:tetratricopeptide repeat protein [Parabacteroides sp. Marseille-P3160]|uniref:tetratricopeptide repeat protein n=1 Tax=Parabacteroides sp. Marseille-P3160 TaxID=1917887 RepID=UPI0009B9447A|nr:tetratricopeptide repeat protein [Parabacteroides sp. Marseille-P3160]